MFKNSQILAFLRFQSKKVDFEFLISICSKMKSDNCELFDRAPRVYPQQHHVGFLSIQNLNLPILFWWCPRIITLLLLLLNLGSLSVHWMCSIAVAGKDAMWKCAAVSNVHLVSWECAHRVRAPSYSAWNITQHGGWQLVLRVNKWSKWNSCYMMLSTTF